MSLRPSIVSFTVVRLAARLALAAGGCGSSSEGPAGGAVTGPLDDHCTAVAPLVVNQASCAATPDPNAPEETVVLYNSAGDDDDCKYHVTFTTTPVRKNENVTFTVTATALAGTKAPVTGANIGIEGELGTAHVLPNNGTKTTESAGGVYTIGPVKFDMSGQWTITYHLFETCHDLPDSPHGHASFFIDVP